MTTLKTLTIATALIAGGTSLAMAQAGGSSGPDGQVTTAASAADNPPAPRHHHQKMYLSAKGSHHKTLKTGQQQPKQP
jgi:hypothetical protein